MAVEMSSVIAVGSLPVRLARQDTLPELPEPRASGLEIQRRAQPKLAEVAVHHLGAGRFGTGTRVSKGLPHPGGKVNRRRVAQWSLRIWTFAFFSKP